MKNCRKLFTKEKKKNIIEKNCNPSLVNKKKLRKKGLSMINTKDIVWNEMTEGVNLKEKIIIRLFFKEFKKIYKKGIKRGFNWNNVT